MSIAYDPQRVAYPCFSAARRAFRDGTDTPRAFLERGLAQIDEREAAVQAFVLLDLAGARRIADASTKRWRDGAPLSEVDGLPFAVKDCYDVRGWPTRVNSALFDDRPAHVDAAHVDALRRGGAAIVGKTVTTELTMAAPGPTWNPWDVRRTPGGSSSGSAAAVAAGFVPFATGSQARGSTIRPASICGVVGMKPTYGAINRNGGFDPSPSLNHIGLLGGTLTDVWEIGRYLARVAGADPGCRPLTGSDTLPRARKPARLIRQYTAGWPLTDDASKAAFEALLQTLGRAGIEIVEPDASAELRAYEDETARVFDSHVVLMLRESLWPLRALLDAAPEGASEAVRGYVAKAASYGEAEIHAAHAKREDLRARHRALTGRADAFISPAHIGPGQIGQPNVGTPWYNDASSSIGAPALSLPLLEVENVPLGVQLVGFEGADDDLAAVAHWMLRELRPRLSGPV